MTKLGGPGGRIGGGRVDREAGVVLGALVPHPLIIVPEVGGSDIAEVQQTVSAMGRMAAETAAAEPDSLVLITPHGPILPNSPGIQLCPQAAGDMASFGAPEVSHTFRNDLPLAEGIIAAARREGIEAAPLGRGGAEGSYPANGLDHGALVPLDYLCRAGLKALPVTVVTPAFLPLPRLHLLGKAIAAAARDTGRRVAVMASGDLSHRLIPDAPAGYDPAGKKFDELVRRALESYDPQAVLEVDSRLARSAGECGLRPLAILLGALDGNGLPVAPAVLSYEGPFGVGYLVAVFHPTLPSHPTRLSGPVQLARESLFHYVRTGKVLSVPSGLPPDLLQPAAAFVSLKIGGELRGCIGSLEPSCDTLAEEIIRNAVQAGTRDPRFSPVREEEMAELDFSVDVLGPLEPVQGIEELDPDRYGVVVEAAGRRGVLLPALEGVLSAEHQVAIARKKAGLAPNKEARLFRFMVVRHH